MGWRLVPGLVIHFLVQPEETWRPCPKVCSQKVNISWLHHGGEEERTCLKGKMHPTPDFC